MIMEGFWEQSDPLTWVRPGQPWLFLVIHGYSGVVILGYSVVILWLFLVILNYSYLFLVILGYSVVILGYSA